MPLITVTNCESVLIISNKFFKEKVERHCAVVDLMKQKIKTLFGDICRMTDERLVKTMMLGMVERDRPRGRPARRWSDDVSDWCVNVNVNLYSASLQKAPLMRAVCGCTLPEDVQLAIGRDEWRRVTDLNGSHEFKRRIELSILKLNKTCKQH